MKVFLILALVVLVLTKSLSAAVMVVCMAVIFKPIFWVLSKTGLLTLPTRITHSVEKELKTAYNTHVLKEIIRNALR